MTRIASIWLPHLPIERWAKSSDYPPETPVVFTVEGTHGLLLHADPSTAAERGARPGTLLVEMSTIRPGSFSSTPAPRTAGFRVAYELR